EKKVIVNQKKLLEKLATISIPFTSYNILFYLSLYSHVWCTDCFQRLFCQLRNFRKPMGWVCTSRAIFHFLFLLADIKNYDYFKCLRFITIPIAGNVCLNVK